MCVCIYIYSYIYIYIYIYKVSTSGGRKVKLLRPNTVVSEQGKKLRVFETDASESGEDVSVSNFGCLLCVYLRVSVLGFLC